ncbi:MAG: gamma carbonic anhydrase family protein, partial [Pseudomonadota bacterium]
MMLASLDGVAPSLGDGVWVADSADVIGDVVLGARSSVWFQAVIRGDQDRIAIGPESNVQDGAVLHTDAGIPLTVGARVTVGHKAMLHGCTIGDDVLIGIGSIVLNGARIGPNSVVGANTLVTEGKSSLSWRATLAGAPSISTPSAND